uniref:Uncharacterized protein n=1 Tax=Aegilops tauschii subsp. strangulata TaxID=200361 RepID=A0A453BIJ8_AEGTS
MMQAQSTPDILFPQLVSKGTETTPLKEISGVYCTCIM